MVDNSKVREASHAGSWYDSDTNKLDTKLTKWLSNTVKNESQGLLRGLIGPHAGFEYSGQTAAWAYININPNNYERVFLLGPCHHKYIKGCGLTECTIYNTPLGKITIDTDVLAELSKNKYFEKIKKYDDEEEHSLEMHLPYIKKIFGTNNFKLVPVMVGSIDYSLEEYFGKIFSEYLRNEKNLFIMSSDFCHWGNSFDYTPYDKNSGMIFEYIRKLDSEGIASIEKQDPELFIQYLKDTENTICGRNPISVYLYALKHSGLKTSTKLLHYAQSNECKKKTDSSVSYSAIVSNLC